MLLNATLSGYVISGVIDVIANYNPSEREHNLRMNHLKDYLRDSSVKVRTANNAKKVHAYDSIQRSQCQHFLFKLSRDSLFDEERIFNLLRPSLRFDVAQIIASHNILDIPMLSGWNLRIHLNGQNI